MFNVREQEQKAQVIDKKRKELRAFLVVNDLPLDKGCPLAVNLKCVKSLLEGVCLAHRSFRLFQFNVCFLKFDFILNIMMSL